MFYLHPLSQVPANPSSPWYTSVPVGRDSLQNKLKNMCKEAGIEGNITNHSLRATSATQMYDKGVPEKIIQERTGHCSLEALWTYERTNEHQYQAVSAILSAPSSSSNTSYNKYIEQKSISHTVCQPHQPLTTSSSDFSFQNLHGCMINITAVSSQPKDNTVTDLMEIDINKLIASIKENY